MSKLLEDPKIAALVEKERAKAVKETARTVAGVIKEALEENKATEDKAVKAAVNTLLRGLNSGIKEALA